MCTPPDEEENTEGGSGEEEDERRVAYRLWLFARAWLCASLFSLAVFGEDDHYVPPEGAIVRRVVVV